MAEPYSPFRYPGGKAKLSSFLIEVIEHSGLQRPNYVEPYAGGAGAALRLLFEEYVDSITINDADNRIWCSWEAIVNYTDDFLELLAKTELTISEWHCQRQIYEKGDVSNVVKLGFATFYLNRTSRSGIIHKSGPIGGQDQSGKYKIDARFNRNKLVRRIQRIGAYSDRITVTNDDGLVLIQKLAMNPHNAGRIFVYLDPPYYVKGASLYMNCFNHNDHAELSSYLGQQSSFPWLLTYDDVPEIRKLYEGLPQKAFSLNYSAYKARIGNELLVYSSSLNVPDQAFEALPFVSNSS